MELEKKFEVGRTYLLETEDEVSSLEVFRSLTREKPGFFITRKNPAHLKEKYELDGIRFGRLSTSGERTAIGPNELDLLGLTIKRFISEEEGIVLLDGIDYLISENDSSKVIRFIQSIQDRISGGPGIVLIVLNSSKLQERNIQRMKNRLTVETINLRYTRKERKKRTPTEQGENLVTQVRSMMEFLKEQEQTIEKEEAQIDQKGIPRGSISNELESLKDEVEALRDQNKALKDELERIKKEREEEGKKEIFEEEIVDEVVATVEEEKEDIREKMEKIEEERDKKSQREEQQSALMDTLQKLENEVGSLRDEVKSIKKESEDTVEDTQKKNEEKTEISDSKTPSETPVKDIKEEEEIGVIDSEATSEEGVTEGEVIEEPKLEDEDLSEEEEVIEEVEPKLMAEGKEEVDERIIYEEDKIILKSDFKIEEDIESDGGIEVQNGVTLKGSLQAEKDIIVGENTTIQGGVVSNTGDVKIKKDCKVTGEISGKNISISERSKVEDINAEVKLELKNNTRARNIICREDVRIFENVEIDGGIDYGGQLDLDGEYINIRGRIRPVENEEEVVKEKWV